MHLNIAAGCHFTDPIALRLSLSTETPLNLFFVLYRMLFIKDVDEILYLICDYPHKHYTFKHFEA